MRAAKQPGFEERAWDELAALYAVDVFERLAANRETRGWAEDVRLRHQFAVIADFHSEVRRIAEVGDRVYIDVIETVITKDDSFAVKTFGVLEFDAAGKIRRTTTYQQWDPDRTPSHVGRTAEA